MGTYVTYGDINDARTEYSKMLHEGKEPAMGFEVESGRYYVATGYAK